MLAVERSIWVDASPDRVWEAVTEPVQIQGWFSPESAVEAVGSGRGRPPLGVRPRHRRGYPRRGHRGDGATPPVVTRSVAGPTMPSQVTAWVLSEEMAGTRVTVTDLGV